ncbi:MAG: hypothetical protein AAF938_28325 [Myxococcota bacterium]
MSRHIPFALCGCLLVACAADGDASYIFRFSERSNGSIAISDASHYTLVQAVLSVVERPGEEVELYLDFHTEVDLLSPEADLLAPAHSGGVSCSLSQWQRLMSGETRMLSLNETGGSPYLNDDGAVIFRWLREAKVDETSPALVMTYRYGRPYYSVNFSEAVGEPQATVRVVAEPLFTCTLCGWPRAVDEFGQEVGCSPLEDLTFSSPFCQQVISEFRLREHGFVD